MGSKKSVPQAQIRALVELGFIVGIPNYRLCPQVSLWEGPIADVLDAVKWIRTELPKKIETKSHIAADVDEMVAFGHSNGGCLALHLVRYEIILRICLSMHDLGKTSNYINIGRYGPVDKGGSGLLWG